jgi:hypothetical protein
MGKCEFVGYITQINEGRSAKEPNTNRPSNNNNILQHF